MLTFVGCSSSNNTTTNDVEFVDVHAFFTAEVDRLTTERIGVFKRTRMGTETQADSNATPNWADELYAFLDLSIKPAVWKTDFAQVTSDEHEEPNETADVYVSTNPNQKIKTFKLKLDTEGHVQRFSAELIEKGKIATTVTGLSYTKNVGYTITIERDTKIMGNESYQIVGQLYKTE